MQKVKSGEFPVPKALPVVKWAGGKRQMIGLYEEYFPRSYNTYHEPFLGGGAVFFHLQPKVAYLSDSNGELVNMYRVIQTRVDQLVEELGRHKNDREYYYTIREQDPRELGEVQRAARLIYLNKTCFNGLYRVNREGRFNVPFGKYRNPNICDPNALVAAHRALEGVFLARADFDVVLDRAASGDFVYLDPPYYPLGGTANFTSFTGHSFHEEDQVRLAGVFHELSMRGCQAMLSNSDTPFIQDLYRRYKNGIIIMSGKRSINSRGDQRGPVNELLICNWLA